MKGIILRFSIQTNRSGGEQWFFSRALKGELESHTGTTEILLYALTIEGSHRGYTTSDRGYVTGNRGTLGSWQSFRQVITLPSLITILEFK